MARGPVAALCVLLCFSATFSSHAQEAPTDLLANVEEAEKAQTEGKAVDDAVVSNVVESAGSAELARYALGLCSAKFCRESTESGRSHDTPRILSECSVDTIADIPTAFLRMQW